MYYRVTGCGQLESGWPLGVGTTLLFVSGDISNGVHYHIFCIGISKEREIKQSCSTEENKRWCNRHYQRR